MRFRNQEIDVCTHFVFAEYQQQPESWEGRVKATTDPIKQSIKTQGKELLDQNKALETKMEALTLTLEKIQDDIMLKQDEDQKKLDTNLSTKLDNLEKGLKESLIPQKKTEDEETPNEQKNSGLTPDDASKDKAQIQDLMNMLI